jgi:uncharacterized protein (UPF0305 family)
MDASFSLRKDLAHFPDERAYIERAISRLGSAGTKGELGTLIAREISHFSMYDLQVIGGKLNREIDSLPSPYREAIRPFFHKQVFGMHHTLLSLSRSGEFARMKTPVTDPEAFRQFCGMVANGCFSWDRGAEMHSHFYLPRHRLFYYLLACFAMFVLDEPGHPVGTPFPGGFSVEKRGGIYYCPVRDREKDVSYSICNVCPARQQEMPQ